MTAGLGLSGMADPEDSDAAEGVVEADGVCRVEAFQGVGDLPRGRPVGRPPSRQAEPARNEMDVGVGRDDEAVRRYPRPEAEVEGVAADHPAQVEVPPLAGRALRGIGKEEAGGGGLRAARAGRRLAGSRRPGGGSRRAREGPPCPLPRRATSCGRRRRRSRPRGEPARSRTGARPRPLRRGIGGGSRRGAPARTRQSPQSSRASGPGAARALRGLAGRSTGSWRPARRRRRTRSRPRPRGPRARCRAGQRRWDRCRLSRRRKSGRAARAFRRAGVAEEAGWARQWNTTSRARIA